MHARPNMKKLTRVYPDKTSDPVWVDITKIAALVRGDQHDRTIVYLTGSISVDVRETPDEIFDPARE